VVKGQSPMPAGTPPPVLGPRLDRFIGRLVASSLILVFCSGLVALVAIWADPRVDLGALAVVAVCLLFWLSLALRDWSRSSRRER